ncbi:MAG: hypothetical protein KKF67_03515, partial [Nanoarchaeota archaeon]|nr:hypothetical protein [Nanoarchaeota archaeon]
MIKLTGKIEKRKSVRILIIHSKKLSEEVVRKKNNISIKNYKNGLILKPEGKVHVTIAAKKRLQIAITKLIKNKDILIKGCGKIS